MAKAFPHLGFRVAYDGTSFSGFQLQPHHHSVQAEIEKALKTLLKTRIRILFSSRTDAGVHAYDQWIMIRNGWTLFEKLPEKNRGAFLISLSALLPPSIRVWKIVQLREDFDPKTSAKWKEYRYQVLQGPVHDPLARDSALWIRRSLNLSAMKKAFREFQGRHDFRAFAKRVHRYGEKTEREIFQAEMRVKAHQAIPDLKVVWFIVKGKGFMHHMVRTMVGTALEVGRGESHDVRALLRRGKRQDAGVNAPPHGLVLWRTEVSRSLFRAWDIRS